MTERTAGRLVLPRLKRQKVEGYFDGGRLTSEAGALLLREVDRRLGLTSVLAACITDPRCVRRIRHDRHRMLTQRVFGIGLGYEDLNDHQSLRDEPLFQVLAEQRPDPDRPLASPATLSKRQNHLNRRHLEMIRHIALLTQEKLRDELPPPQNGRFLRLFRNLGENHPRRATRA